MIIFQTPYFQIYIPPKVIPNGQNNNMISVRKCLGAAQVARHILHE